MTRRLIRLKAVLAVAALVVSALVAPQLMSASTATARAAEPSAVELGTGGSGSGDRALLATGDASGFHILVADASDGYQWRTAASLSEPGLEPDLWIGNACVTGSGRHAVVVYAPRAFTNKSLLADRGGFTAVVDLLTGTVKKLPVRTSLAYFNPSCGVGDEAVLTQGGDEDLGKTRLLRVNAATATVGEKIVVPGQLTSAVPTPSGIIAADAGVLVRVDGAGVRRAVAATRGVAFNVAVDGDGGVVYMEHRNGGAAVRRAVVERATKQRLAPTTTLATGGLTDLDVTSGRGGRVFITGKATSLRRAAMPPSVSMVAGGRRLRMSTDGRLAITGVRDLSQPDSRMPVSDLSQPHRLRVAVRELATGKKVKFTVAPAAQGRITGRTPSPALGTTETTEVGGDPHDPAEYAERYCSVPRNDPRNQAMQPKPRQVEWAVDQAVRDSLYVQRPENWKNLGMPAYTPQGLFEYVDLDGGGYVPAQVMLGVAAQESNLWQAARFAIPGVTANPLIGNYYGADKANGDYWTIHWEDADCGYGVTQLTDGMRLKGREKPGETALPYQTQRAAALDFAANIAAGVQKLQQKWNETRRAGLILNNGDPAKIENWFYAVWAYNSGFHAKTTDGSPWGVGWANNPVNPRYKPNRDPFLEYSREDAKHPQDWPYPEKVMGFAAYPVEVPESPGKIVPGYRAAWWSGGDTLGPINRRGVKPPVDQFCDETNDCEFGAQYTPNDPDVIGEPAGPCAHTNGSGLYDLKCWYHEPSTWKELCSYTCGNELLRFDPGYPYQEDGTAYPPRCTLDGLPSNAKVIDDLPDGTPSIRPNCARTWSNAGTFTFTFQQGSDGNYAGKIDTHQIGGGFGGHFWFSHTRHSDADPGSRLRAEGTWRLSEPITGWARVLVHLPDHGAHTQQARYTIHLGDGTSTERVLLQKTEKNTWVSLGAFKFSGTPSVTLSTRTNDGDGTEDVAWDAVAFQPLPGKPKHQIVAMGDSYSSGEGASEDAQSDYYRESDDDGGGNAKYRNGCHRSRHAWSRQARAADNLSDTIGYRADHWSVSMDFHLIACSGAVTQDVLYDGQHRELAQYARGYLDDDTTLVTLSIGGNDARFGPIITFCIERNSCHEKTMDGDTEPLDSAERKLISGQVKQSVREVVERIHDAAPHATIVLMGYPRLFDGVSSDGWCLTIPGDPTARGIDPGEIRWVHQMVDLMAAELGDVASSLRASSGIPVYHSDPRDEFAGRGACSANPAIHEIIVAKTEGEDPDLTKAPVSQQSMHPTVDGAALYARALEHTLRSIGI